MAKPILIARIPEPYTIGEYEEHSKLFKMFDDYHVLLVFEERQKSSFEVFYEKDFNHVKFEELKEIIKEKHNG